MRSFNLPQKNTYIDWIVAIKSQHRFEKECIYKHYRWHQFTKKKINNNKTKIKCEQKAETIPIENIETKAYTQFAMCRCCLNYFLD